MGVGGRRSGEGSGVSVLVKEAKNKCKRRFHHAFPHSAPLLSALFLLLCYVCYSAHVCITFGSVHPRSRTNKKRTLEPIRPRRNEAIGGRRGESAKVDVDEVEDEERGLAAALTEARRAERTGAKETSEREVELLQATSPLTEVDEEDKARAIVLTFCVRERKKQAKEREKEKHPPLATLFAASRKKTLFFVSSLLFFLSPRASLKRHGSRPSRLVGDRRSPGPGLSPRRHAPQPRLGAAHPLGSPHVVVAVVVVACRYRRAADQRAQPLCGLCECTFFVVFLRDLAAKSCCITSRRERGGEKGF